MRLGWFFIEQGKPAEGEIPGFFCGLEEVLDIEFPSLFLYPDLVPLIIDGQALFDNLAGGSSGGCF